MKKLVLAAAIVASLAVGEASAQTTATATLAGTVEQSLYIDLDAAGEAVTFTNANVAAFNLGHAEVAGGTLVHKGNVAHSVSVAADAATMTATTGGRTDKPASDVQWSTDGSTFTGLGTTAGSVAAEAAGEYSKPLSYRMLLAWASDTPATYTLGVTYTIAAN